MLRVSGNRVLNAQGQTVYLRGTTKYGFENFPAGGSWGNTYLKTYADWQANQDQVIRVLDAMKSWGVNVVRMPQAIDIWKQNQGSHRQIIKELLVLMQERGMYLVYAPFIITGTDTGYITSILPYPPYVSVAGVVESEQDFINYIASIASELKDYPNVIFEFFNEPTSGTYNEYMGTAFNSWVSVTQRCIDAVRATGAQQLILVQWWWGSFANLAYPDSVWGLGWVSAMNPIDPLNNIVISTHLYRRWGAFHYDTGSGRTNAWTREEIELAFDRFQFAEVAAIYPLIIGEIGCSVDVDKANELSAFNTCLDIFKEQGYHWISWWFSNVEEFREHNGESSNFAPNEAGQIVIDALALAPNGDGPTPIPFIPRGLEAIFIGLGTILIGI